MKKRFLFLALASFALFSCQKDNFVETPTGTTEASALRLKINIDASGTRAVEDLHNAATIYPKIYSVTLYTYNEYNTLTQVDLTADQVKAAINGSYTNAGGTSTTGGGGTNIGLPIGTTRVDVVINNPSNLYNDISTNINYYNHRQDDSWITSNSLKPYGDNNFDRVFLITDKYGTGYDLPSSASKTEDGIPVYELAEFTVKPALARFEIYGAVNVKPSEKFIDKYGIAWREIDKVNVTDAALAKMKPQLEYIHGIAIGTGTGTGGNGFPTDRLYIPNYYWNGTTGAEEVLTGNIAADKWVANEFYYTTTETPTSGELETQNGVNPTDVTWYPNSFYAVDVEEVYMNNILVRGNTSNYKPYLLSWPGSEYSKGWPNWYKSYHIDGWHTAGTSADNTFLCMGNMWDRIAEPKSTSDTDFKKVNWDGLNVPNVSGGGSLEMRYITSKAQPKNNVSAYADATASRNLGLVAKDATSGKQKVAAYMFYGQSSNAAKNDKDGLAGELPHIVLKVKCYANAQDYANGTYKDNKQFITLSLFSSTDKGSDYVTSYQRGKIYLLDLNDLLNSFVGDRPVPGAALPDGKEPGDPVDPDPEMPGVKAVIKVKVDPWTTETVHPVI